MSFQTEAMNHTIKKLIESNENKDTKIAELEAEVERLKADRDEWRQIALVMDYAHDNFEPRALAEASEKIKTKAKEQ